MDKVPLKKVVAFEAALQAFAHTNYKAMLDGINATAEVLQGERGAAEEVHRGLRRHRHLLRRQRGKDHKTMPGTKEIRSKIASVKSTQKITKAMQMVATSKMRRAQERMRLARPYATKMRNVIGHLTQANPDYRHPFARARASPRRSASSSSPPTADWPAA